MASVEERRPPWPRKTRMAFSYDLVLVVVSIWIIPSIVIYNYIHFYPYHPQGQGEFKNMGMTPPHLGLPNDTGKTHRLFDLSFPPPPSSKSLVTFLLKPNGLPGLLGVLSVSFEPLFDPFLPSESLPNRP